MSRLANENDYRAIAIELVVQRGNSMTLYGWQNSGERTKRLTQALIIDEPTNIINTIVSVAGAEVVKKNVR